MPEQEVLRVSTKSNPNAVAGALAGVIREKGEAEIRTIGAGALNQAVKAIAIARGLMAPAGVDLIMRPAFSVLEDKSKPDGVVTAIRLLVEPK